MTLQKLWGLLTTKQRQAAVMLLGLMLISMVLETLGVGLVIPILALMVQSDLASRYPALTPWLSQLGNPSHEHLVVGGMLILVGVYATKALFLGFFAWRQARFVYSLQADLSQRLFVGYLRQPYTFHLQRNSAQLIRNVVGEVDMFAQTGLISGMTILAELFASLGILSLLLAVEPLGALLVMSMIGLAGWSFIRVTRDRVLWWGEARQLHDGLRVQHLQQGLGGVKDIKLLGREEDFLAKFQAHNVGSARVGQRQSTLQSLPRLWLEFLAVAGLATLVLVMILRGKPLDALLPTLGLFSAAAFRLMPSVSRVLGALQGVRFSLPVINALHSELDLFKSTPAPQPEPPLPFNRMLTLDQVCFSYPSAEMPALQSISLSLPRGISVGFIGGSGAGKSTLVDIILGLLAPGSGSVKVDDVDIQSNLRGWQQQIGYVPQFIYLTDDTLCNNVAFGVPSDQIDEATVWRAICDAQLSQFVQELPQGLDTRVGERGVRLSGGQRQRIGIARALYHNPRVLVLDEATSSLDTATENGVMEAVRALRGDKTVIIVAHRLSTVEHCDALFRLERGQIVEAGDTAAVLGKMPGQADS